jgi:hypothetical protein
VSTKSATATTSISDLTARWFLVCFAPVVFIVVLFGWHRILASHLKANMAPLAWVVAGFIATCVIVAAAAVAAERLNRKAEPSQETHRDYTWVAFLLFLISASTLGTLSTTFFIFESKQVLKETVTAVRSCVNGLEYAARPLLQTVIYTDKLARVAEARNSWAAEIKNKNNCGDGREAHARFKILQAELPRLREPSGSRPNCRDPDATRNLDAHIQQVDERIQEQIKNLDELTTDRVSEKQELGKQLDRIKAASDNLAVADGSSATAVPALEAAKHRFEDLNKDIGASLERARSLALGEQGLALQQLACPVDLANLEGVSGSPWQTIPLIFRRGDRGETYGYILAALLFDGVLVMVFARVIRSARGGAIVPVLKKDASGRPRYLWVNPQSD